MTDTDLKDFLKAICRSWSAETSLLWLPENSARGQCNVTSLVFNDHFGGEILKTLIGNQWHFYNRVEGTIYDLTVEQFNEPPSYLNILSSQEEALAGTLPARYQTLAKRVRESLSKK